MIGSAAERVLIVDERNQPIGEAPRARMRAERLVHRVTYVFVHDDRQNLFVHRRPPSKDVFPSYYDAAAGGVVQVGESYDESAAREAEEELGIHGVLLTPHLEVYYQDPHTRCWGRVYTCLYSGPFRFQPEEVVSGRFEPLAAVIEERIRPLTPDTLHALRALLARSGGALPGPQANC